ncbi:chemotaxis protein CheA [Marinoscillum luteum]|uniref:Chemotaxis protein CheA n=1 Tax=Marinoscillum luteum TaxID=861051 RepID=A0ABW7N9I5_9BACT
MKSKESEYKELFLIEAKDQIEELDKLFVELEKDQSNQDAIDGIFRITHTLKGNAMGLGLDGVSELSHAMEDVMIAIRNKQITLSKKLFEILFRANDKLTQVVRALETNQKVSYLGIKTSLSIFLKNELDKGAPAAPKEEEIDHQEEETTKQEGQAQVMFSDVIQIPVKKMDDLLNEVGQLIIERDRLIAFSQDIGLATAEFERLKRISSNLQYSIMNARMIQVGFLFNKFHRVVRDAAAIEVKNVALVLKGTEIEIDRNVLKVISDSLVHLVRNAVSHGIEPEAKRVENGKPPEGSITLDARYERDRVIIVVKDDGAGIDHEVIRKKIVQKGMVADAVAKDLTKDEVLRYIFESGFSNSDKVNEISGRGVGMDVVKKAVESIGGQVRIETEVGTGTTVNLHVPSSLALKGTLLFDVGGQEYAMALSYTEAVVTIARSEIYKLSGGLMAKYQDEAISIVFLKDILEMKSLDELGQRGSLQKSFELSTDDDDFNVIIVSYMGQTTGVIVDKVLQQKEIIEKPLAKPINKTKLLSGTTILGSGNVCPVIDIAALTDLIHLKVLQSK